MTELQMMMLMLGYCAVIIVGLGFLLHWLLYSQSGKNLPNPAQTVMRKDGTIDIVDSYGTIEKRNIFGGYVPKDFMPHYHD